MHFDQTITLTIGSDEITGTSGNDVFNAPLVAVQDPSGVGEAQTLNDGDILDGGAGVDRLNARLIEATTTPESIVNIEQFFLRSTAGASTLNAMNVDGLEQLWNDRSTQNLSVNNLQDSVTLGLNQVARNTTFEATYAANTATQNVVLQGAGRAPTAGGNDAVTLDVTGATTITTLSLNVASGVNNIIADGDLDDISRLNITGSGTLFLEAAANDFRNIITIAVGNFAGDLDLNISGQDFAGGEGNIVLGSGDNRLVIDGSQDLDGVSIDLGAGYNILAVGDLNALDLSEAEIVYAHVQELEFGASTAGDLDLENWTAVETLTFADTLAVDADITIENAPSTLTVNFEGAVTGANTIDFQEAENLFINNTATVDDITITGEELVNVVIVAEANFGATTAVTIEGNTADEWSLSTLTLIDLSDDGDVEFGIVLDETVELKTIDASSMQDGSEVTINATNADFGSAVTILIGKLGFDADGATTGVAFTYETTGTNAVREVFRFVGEDIGEVVIDGFQAGVLGSNDRLDFSQFAGVSSLDDLNVDDSIAGTYVFTSDGFTGEITLVNVVGNPTDDAANFIF
ncbi:hypothetical protein [Desulfonatronum parangueonense]